MAQPPIAIISASSGIAGSETLLTTSNSLSNRPPRRCHCPPTMLVMAMLRTGEVAFDLFFPTSERIPRLVAGGLFQPLNHDYLPNLANMWPQLADPFYDKGSRYTVPYVVYQTGIGWRTDMVDADIERTGENRLEHLRRLGEVANILLDAGLIVIATAVELTQEDIEVIRTSGGTDRVIAVWLGDRMTTDLSCDLVLTPQEAEGMQETARNLFYDQSFAEKMLAQAPTQEEAERQLANRFMAAKLGWEPRWFNPGLERWLHRIKLPTLVLWGADDKLLPSRNGCPFCRRSHAIGADTSPLTS